MSWQATLWAANLPHSRVGHVPFRVLMLLADHAHEDGTATWRSVSSIAHTLDVSERTVHRAIAELKASNLITPGDSRLLTHIPPNKRPAVYNLNLTAENELLTGVTNLSGVTSGVAPLEEEPPLTTYSNHIGNHTGRVTPGVTCPADWQGGPHILGDFGHCVHCHEPWESILETRTA